VDRHADSSSDTRVDNRKIKISAELAITTTPPAPAPPAAPATAGAPPVTGELSGGTAPAGSGRAGRGTAPPCRLGCGKRRTGTCAARGVRPRPAGHALGAAP